MKARHLFNLRSLMTFGTMFLFLSIGAAAPQAALADGCESTGWSSATSDETTTTCVNTTYEVIGKNLLQYDYSPVGEQVHLISVAKGQKQTLSESQTVTRQVQVSATAKANTPLFKAISFSLTASYTGTKSQTYTTTTVYDGPEASSPYNSRNYYSGTVYDLYNVTLREIKNYTETYEYYEYGTRTRFNEYSWSEYGNTITEQAQAPRIITYSRDSLY